MLLFGKNVENCTSNVSQIVGNITVRSIFPYLLEKLLDKSSFLEFHFILDENFVNVLTNEPYLALQVSSIFKNEPYFSTKSESYFSC